MIMNKKYNKRPAAELFVILKTICFLPGRFLYNVNSFNQRIKISSRLYVDTCIVNPLSDIGAGVINFTLTLWFYVFSWVGKLNFARHQKKKKKKLHNLRSSKTLQIQIGGLKTKHLPVHCLQRVVHYFNTVKNKSYSILFFKRTNKRF